MMWTKPRTKRKCGNEKVEDRRKDTGKDKLVILTISKIIPPILNLNKENTTKLEDILYPKTPIN